MSKTGDSGLSARIDRIKDAGLDMENAVFMALKATGHTVDQNALDQRLERLVAATFGTGQLPKSFLPELSAEETTARSELFALIAANVSTAAIAQKLNDIREQGLRDLDELKDGMTYEAGGTSKGHSTAGLNTRGAANARNHPGTGGGNAKGNR